MDDEYLCLVEILMALVTLITTMEDTPITYLNIENVVVMSFFACDS